MLKALDTSAEVRTRGDAGSAQARGKRATLSRSVALLSARGVRRRKGFSEEGICERRPITKETQIQARHMPRGNHEDGLGWKRGFSREAKGMQPAR
jgi:hypothetical protein